MVLEILFLFIDLISLEIVMVLYFNRGWCIVVSVG